MLALALLLACPAVLAHGGHDEGGWLGDTSLHFRLLGAPLAVAGAPLRAEVETDAPLSLEASLVPPEGAPGAWFPLRMEGAFYAADVMLPTPGAWEVRVRSGEDVAAFAVDVWPAGATFVEPAGEAASRGVVVHGRGEPVAMQLVDRQHAPVAPPGDAIARIEGPTGVETRPLAAKGGVLVLEHAWPSPGGYEIEVLAEQAGLAAGARPPVEVLVVAPDEASVYGLESREVPAGLLIVPAAFLALALRKVTRARP